MDFWSIKYVQTRGIVKYDGCEEYSPDGIVRYANRNPGHCSSPYYVLERIGYDCFVSEAEARAQASVRINRLIIGLERRRKKLAAILADLESGGSGAPKKRAKK